MPLAEEELIAYAKPYLKAKGFKKKNKRWTREADGFIIDFFIQGSCYDKTDYYIRPAIWISALKTTPGPYMWHWGTQLAQTTPEDVMRQFDVWSAQWTDKARIRERLLAFIEWERRNPLEKRRAGLANDDADPAPAREFFMMDEAVKQYILEHF